MRKLVYFTFFAFLFAFSFWLMWHTLSYDSTSESILVSSKYWSDFGGHLPQIRSFSKGENWPPQYPLYPGEPIRYHFLFYFLVGLLEKSGLRIDWATNLPSAIGLFFLLVLIFITAKRIFTSTLTGLLSLLFFLFNGSFSWLDYLKSNNFDIQNSLLKLPALSNFPSFGPWSGSLISAFWNLNIYTNQRHLGLSFALVLVVIYILFTSNKKLSPFVGFILGLLVVLNQAAAVIAALFISWFFLFRRELRGSLIMSLLGFFPWLFFSFTSTQTSPHISLRPGFLQSLPLEPIPFFKYWLYNFGLHLVLIPLGFLVAPRRAKILFPPLLLIFIVSNIVQFSTDMINNHKFFNFYLTLGSMYSAYLLTKVKPFIIFLPILILGGIIDFFPVKNDIKYSLSDYPKNPDIQFFLNRTRPDSVILNSTWFYHPASFAGRSIYNGYSYFTWSFGYDQVKREQQTLAIYRASDKDTACHLLKSSNISFVELNRLPEKFIEPNMYLWQTEFVPAYANSNSGVTVYDVSQNCGRL